ncbi:DUF4385 domain-containing protein [Rhodococcus ruber]|uniref:Uncharacterized protein n=1 Tax=Rhodococcus ruber TaxID=1830 RepID=A0A098BSB5_9NOCA|nr:MULTISPECIES: DUF4385 domain-containing protein [Rhodococcus]MDO2379929.1 DUF4385 domain-containing protein [Rhodococcus ruber]AUM16290.1 DUF4385 domain-containing protein [Rhodococcus ruber]MBD8052417.1 DUF4385 domain-containing protein [Rhodococcus ruber]MCD2125451.1 DUF4385 domain-containing protein [Rhodococcus ruber]MCF8783949.1 DUF4385 domain-containing protein [Rhodococcus ruber]
MTARRGPRPFDYSLDYANLDLRRQPHLYRVGRGEQGVLKVEPYKSELLPHWRFATVEQARTSAGTILTMFFSYLDEGDFVGADMARKFLQMGYTRARRYAARPGGRKYDGPVPQDRRGRSGAHGRAELPRGPEDAEKAAAAAVFEQAWDRAAAEPRYVEQRRRHRELYG